MNLSNFDFLFFRNNIGNVWLGKRALSHGDSPFLIRHVTRLNPNPEGIVQVEFSFRYTAIRTRDLDRSLKFYVGALGMKLLHRSKTPIGEFAVVKSNDSAHQLEINYYPEASLAGGPYNTGSEADHLAFKVSDVDEAVAYLKEKGYPAVFGPETFGDWRVAYVADPDGIWIELLKNRAIAIPL